MSYKAEGRIHLKGDTEQITERFTKREFVVMTDESSRYPQYVSFQLTGQRCDMLDQFDVGDVVEIEFRLNGRQWTSPNGDVRFFNSLVVFGIDRVGPVANVDPGVSDRDMPVPDAFSDDEIPF